MKKKAKAIDARAEKLFQKSQDEKTGMYYSTKDDILKCVSKKMSARIDKLDQFLRVYSLYFLEFIR